MTETNRKASATARTRATTKYHKTHYKRMYISTTPEQADYIRETAKQFDISIVQLIINSVNEYKTNHGADTEQPEIITTKSPMKSGKTAGAQPEEETQEDEDEDEDEKPEDMPAFVWEQIQRLKKADKRHTTERKAREAAERKRRRLGEIED